ncbi:hypothetical protein ANCCEY_07703, partial [Ancylostoma ceylanicum]
LLEIIVAVIDFCSLDDPTSCGEGKCIFHHTGNRCKCPDGWMGRRCATTTHHNNFSYVYRNLVEGHARTSTGAAPDGWRKADARGLDRYRRFSPTTAGCLVDYAGVMDSVKLPLTLPPILDNIAWFVGRWECKTTAGERIGYLLRIRLISHRILTIPWSRFPEPMSGPYREILEVQISDVPMFDRPPVNVSTIAVTNDGRDVHSEVGFMTSKPFLEDTGFVEFNKPKQGDDLVGIETVSNNG